MEQSVEVQVQRTPQDFVVPKGRASTRSDGKVSDEQAMVAQRELHSKHLKQELLHMYRSQALCDVTITAGHIRIPCHRNVLAAGSPYFFAMFNSEMQEAIQFRGEIELKGIEPSCLETIIDYFYTGDINVHENNAQALMEAADMLCLDPVRERVGKFYQQHLTPNNCLGFWALGDRLNDKKLANAALDFAAERFEEVCADHEFLDMDGRGVQQLLRHRDIVAPSEDVICLAGLKWLDHDPEKRASQMVTVLSGIRFLDLSKDFIRFQLMEHPALQNEGVLIQRFRDALDHMTYNAPVPKWLELNPPRMKTKTETCIIIVAGSLIIDERVGDIRLSFKVDHDYDGSCTVADYCRLPSKEWGFADVCDFDNTLYVAGVNGLEMWRYECHMHVWTRCADLLRTREWPQAVFGFSGKFYLLGGYDEVRDGGVAEIDEYNTKTNTWKEVGKLLHPVYLFGSFFYAGSVYAVGGIIKHDPVSNTATQVCNYIQQYNTLTKNTCLIATTLPYSSGGLRAAVIRDKFVVFGRKYVYVAETSVLTDVTKKVQMKAKPGLNKSYFGLSVYGDKVVALGGSVDENTYSDEVVEASIHQLLDTSTKELDWKLTGHLPHKMRIFMTAVLKMTKRPDTDLDEEEVTQ